jgi:hypothetical protein
MKKHVQTFLYSLSLFSSLFFAKAAEAKLTFRDFKNVTRHFKPGKEYNSPTLGQALLESGVVHDLRFNWDFESGYKEGRREYVKDHSTDSIWNLDKLLFPSPAGELTTVTSAPTNFGNNVTSVESVAILMNFANRVRAKEADFRQQMQRQMKKNKLETEEAYFAWAKKQGMKKSLFSKKELDQVTEDLLKSMGKADASKKIKDDLKKNGITPLLMAIQGAIEEENKPHSLIPQHLTEGLIASFFCEKFNSQDDTLNLLWALDDDLVDKSTLPEKLERLEEEELASIAVKKEPLDYDDFYALANAPAFHATTPYKAGQNPLSNERAYYFDRKSGELDLKADFADCVETSLRHVMNLLLYDPETKTFRLDHVKAQFEGKNNPYIQNLFKFYEKQDPDNSNNGNIDFRSLWNGVVGDLNAFDKLPHEIRYGSRGNNIASGFVNAFYVLEKIFDLKFGSFPENGTPEDKTDWVKASFLKFCQTVNPTRNYKIEFLNPDFTTDRVTGNLQVTVSAFDPTKQQEENLFFFGYGGISVHMSIHKVEDLKSKNTAHQYGKLLDQKMQKVSSAQDDSEDVLWLLSPEAIAKKHIHAPLFDLFSFKINDADSRISFVQKIHDNFNLWKEHPAFSKIVGSLSHVLAEMSWEDAHTIQKASPLILPFLEIPELRHVLSEKVKRLELTGSQVEDLNGLGYLKNLERLNLTNTKKLKSLSVVGLEKLIDINLLGSHVQEIVGLETLSKLARVSLEDAKLINFLPPSVDVLQVSPSDVENFSELLNEKLPNLTNLNLIPSGNQKSLNNFEIKGHQSLNKITLRSTMQYVNFENMPQLTDLNILHSNIRDLSLKSLPKLEDINLKGKNVEKLSLRNLGNLTGLRLDNTKKLQELELHSLPTLQTISLSGSLVNAIHGVNPENLPNLKRIAFDETAQLEEVSLKGLNSVEDINFANSGIRRIEGLNNLPNLRTLNLGRTQNLEEVTLQNLDQLRDLKFNGSHVKKLYLENLNSIGILQLNNMPLLEEIVFKGSFRGLKEFGVTGSKNLKRIEGLENLESLVVLHARNSLPKQKITGLRSGVNLLADERDE